MKYMLIAGEASGDLHASHLIKWIKEFDREADFRFFGGDLMAVEARRKPDLHYDMMNVMGFSEVLRKLPTLASNLRRAKRLLREYRPDALVLVDYPGFNLTLAKYAHRLGVRCTILSRPKCGHGKNIASRQSRNMSTGCIPFCRSRCHSTRSMDIT